MTIQEYLRKHSDPEAKPGDIFEVSLAQLQEWQNSHEFALVMEKSESICEGAGSGHGFFLPGKEKCPYCNVAIEINHDNGYGYETGEMHQQMCHSCEKTFVFYTYVDHSYEISMACPRGGSLQVEKEGCEEPSDAKR